MVKWTFVLLITCTVIFLLQQIVDLSGYYFTPSLVLQKPWIFITSMFLHADISHLFFNMFALFIFGLALENEIGSKHFLIIYFIAGIAGSVGYMITANNPTIPALGASGAIYGVMGSLSMLMPFMMVWAMGMVPLPMIVMAFVWTLMEFLGIFNPGSGIAHGAHLGGLFIGIVYGLILKILKKRRQEIEKIRFEESM